MHISETMVRNIPIEVFENKAPIRFDQLSLREDSGGPGKHRGGLGIRRDFRVLKPVGALSIIQKTRTDNWGLEGGEPGKKNVVVLESDEDDFEERIEVLVDNDHLHDGDGKHVGMFRGNFAPGEVISNRTAGGGGYGDPYERDPERVLEDYRDGYVSRDAARDQYGVVITEDGKIAHDETKTLRADR